MENINIHSKNVEYYYEQANMLRERGDSEEAIKAYDKVIELDPNHVEAYYFKGYALEHLVQTSGDISKYQEAIKAYNKAIELNLNYAPAHYFKGVLWKIIGDIESKKAFDEFYKLRPEMRKSLDERSERLDGKQEINIENFTYCKIDPQSGVFIYPNYREDFKNIVEKKIRQKIEEMRED